MVPGNCTVSTRNFFVNFHLSPNGVAYSHGPMLVYEWIPGELLGVERSRRSRSGITISAISGSSLSDLLTALNVAFDLQY
jgi:hypothetical protein